jgi:uncharacterized protein
VNLLPATLVAAALIAAPGLSHAACSEDVIDLRGDSGQFRFRIEVADDPVEQARGLMFRESMPRFSGMLFVYDRPVDASFWMKNTLIPLDMLFIDAAGIVTHVHADAVPGDLTSIGAPDLSLAVLEINGGLAAALGIVPGVEVRHPAFDPANAAWPCD